MSSRPQTPSHEIYGSAPAQAEPSALAYRNSMNPNEAYLASSQPGAHDFATHSQGAPSDGSLLHQGSRFNEEWDASQRGSTFFDGQDQSQAGVHRSESVMSYSGNPSRQGTLKKKASLSKKGSLRRGGSRRSSRAGSVRSVYLGEKEKYDAAGEEQNSAFFTPIPTQGTPTDVLAHRFQDWRKVLKDLIAYFKDIQKSYELRAKSLSSVANISSSISTPASFLPSGGIGDAAGILNDFHRQSISAASRAKEIEGEVILQLTGLRSDLQQKIKEIKGLSGDFKNSVDKEMDHTRKAVRGLQEALGLVDTDPHATSGKGDPFLIKLSVDKQLDRQIEEENYLHRAYLNLEHSGRELESIVVGEIQKAYNAYAGIIKREADEAYETVEKLRDGPISLPKDHEWISFVEKNEHMVDQRTAVRNVEQVHYPGKDHPAAAEVRSGMLERKSKYLKSYTPGWYVLSPTHLHEFKSADRISVQAPVMSLYLPEQKLGSHSQGDSSSHKFMLKGRQTGSMHRGHAWVFRAESHDTMLAWIEDIRNLTEKTGEDRNAFVRRHVRSFSNASKTGSVSSEGGMDEDEADRTPYSADTSVMNAPVPVEPQPKRPQPGGRFPSDLQIDRRSLQAPLSPSSGESSGERDALAAAGALPGSGIPFETSGQDTSFHDSVLYGNTNYNAGPAHSGDFVTQPPAAARQDYSGVDAYTTVQQPDTPVRHDSNYGTWLAPAAGGAVTGIAATDAYKQYKQRHPDPEPEEEQVPEVAELATDANNTAPVGFEHKEDADDTTTLPSTVYTPIPITTSNPSTTATNDGTQKTDTPLTSDLEHLDKSTIPTTDNPVYASSFTQDPIMEPIADTNTVDPAVVVGPIGANIKPSDPAIAAASETAVSAPTPSLYNQTRPKYISQDSTFTISDLVQNIPGNYPKEPKT